MHFLPEEPRDKNWITDPTCERAARSRKKSQTPIRDLNGEEQEWASERAVDRPAQREDSQILVVESYERQKAGVQGVDGGCSCWTTERVLQKAPWWAQKQDQRLRHAMCLAESAGAGAWHIFCSRKRSKPRESGLGGFKVQKVKQAGFF